MLLSILVLTHGLCGKWVNNIVVVVVEWSWAKPANKRWGNWVRLTNGAIFALWCIYKHKSKWGKFHTQMAANLWVWYGAIGSDLYCRSMWWSPVRMSEAQDNFRDRVLTSIELTSAAIGQVITLSHNDDFISRVQALVCPQTDNVSERSKMLSFNKITFKTLQISKVCRRCCYEVTSALSCRWISAF